MKACDGQPWWVGIPMYCDYCEYSVEIEPHDKVKLFSESNRDYKRVTIPCPTCNTDLRMTREIAVKVREKLEAST